MLLRKEKREHFKNINLKTDSNSFWQACKPFLSSKGLKTNNKISLIENGEVISDESRVSNIFNEYFINVTNFFISL